MSETLGHSADAANNQQFLAFILAGEEYAADILKVQEIRDWSECTYIPNSPNYLEGVLNLRGDIIPIVNLRSRFGLAPPEMLDNRIVIVLTIDSHGKNRSMGLLVDAFSETYNIDMTTVRAAPANVSVVDDEFIVGLTTIDKKMLILLDVDELLNSGELAVSSNENAA